MSDIATRFLLSLGQALATHGLYEAGHPARERGIDTAFGSLCRILETRPSCTFSFVGGDTIVDGTLLPEMASWEWGSRLAAVGAARLEIDADVTREAFDAFVDDVGMRLNGRRPESAVTRQLVYSAIRYGALHVERAEGTRADPTEHMYSEEDLLFALDDEVETIGFIHGEVRDGKRLPMHEVETVVRTLGMAMRRESRMLLPLLHLRQYDQYTTTHASNVSVLAMALAEAMQLSADEVRSFGVAGLLHDIGKMKIPKEVLTKAGRFTDEERAIIQQHPIDGARMLLDGRRGLGLAAIVAYEHHICIDGTGYPSTQTRRQCHCASRVVHICDVYDALCTDRPYREAWPAERATAYIEERAGTEFDARIANTFVRMIKEASVVDASADGLQPAPATATATAT